MVILTIKNQDTFEFYGYEAIVGLSASKHGDIWVVKKWGEHAINWRITTAYYYWGGLPLNSWEREFHTDSHRPQNC